MTGGGRREVTTGEGRKPFEKGFSSFPRTPILLSETFYFFRLSVGAAKGKREGRNKGARDGRRRHDGGTGGGEGGGSVGGRRNDVWEERGKWIESGRNGGARGGREDSEMGGGKRVRRRESPRRPEDFFEDTGPVSRRESVQDGGAGQAAPRPSDGGNQPGQGFSLKQKAGTKAGPAGQTGGGQASARSLPQKTAESPAKKILPRATSGNVREAFFLAVWRSASSSGRPQKRDASRRSFFAVPRRRCAIPRRCFLHRPIPKAQRSSRPRLSSEPLFLCALPGARPAAQVLRLST